MLEASVSWFAFTFGKKGEEIKCSLQLFSSLGAGWSCAGSCEHLQQHLVFLTFSKAAACCIGDVSSSELDKSCRCSPVVTDRVSPQAVYWATHIVCRYESLSHQQRAHEHRVACETVSFRLVPQALQCQEGSWTGFHLGTSMSEMWLFECNNSFVENVYKCVFTISYISFRNLGWLVLK